MEETLKIGIVGSRRRATLGDRKIVLSLIENIIKENPGRKIELVSGGCRTGADSFAESAAKILNLPIKIFPPKLQDGMKYPEMVAAYYSRNREIAEYADRVYGLVSPDRTGGTENTLKHAKEFKKPTFSVDVRGVTYLEE